LAYLKQQGCPWNSRTYSEAAYAGHLHILQWAHEQGCPWEIDDVVYSALNQRHWHIWHWLRHTHGDLFEANRKFADTFEYVPYVDPPGGYEARQHFTVHHNLCWPLGIRRWVVTIRETLEQPLQKALCPDLVLLIQRYV